MMEERMEGTVMIEASRRTVEATGTTLATEAAEATEATGATEATEATKAMARRAGVTQLNSSGNVNTNRNK